MCMKGPIASRSYLYVYYFLIYCSLHRIHFSHAMASRTDQTLHATSDAAVGDAKTVSRAKSDTMAASSSSNVSTKKIANKDVPVLTDYWKKSSVIEADRSAYHVIGSLPDGSESFIRNLEFPTVYNTIVVFFESHLITRLGLPPSKFLVFVLNFLRCVLVHLNPNAITALSCFTMLCVCWLRITPNTSLFWYYYSLARYEKIVFSGIGLSLCCHRRKKYLDATFRGS
jgi:hypothetical protein